MAHLNIYHRIICVFVLVFGHSSHAFRIQRCSSNMISEVDYDNKTNKATINFEENRVRVTSYEPFVGENILIYCTSDTLYDECKLTHKPDNVSKEYIKCRQSFPPICREHGICDDIIY